MTVALIVAAGSGERLGAGRPKALVEVAGRPLVQWSIDALARVTQIERIVLALPAGVAAPADVSALAGVTAVEGGPVRSDSVRRALATAGPGEPRETILVHDAARPLLTSRLAEAVIAALEADSEADGAIAAVPVTDTIKRADADRVVHGTLDRSVLWSVQTPQAFRRGALQHALDVSAEELARATDDASLIEQRGGKVIVVPASGDNLKVTTPLDLQLAELLLRARGPSAGD